MLKITKKTKIAAIFKQRPEMAEILMIKYGLHCFGCIASAFENLEQGAKAHGMSNKEIEKMVRDLNK